MDDNEPNLEVVHNTSTRRFEVDLGDDTGIIAYQMQGPDVYVLLHTVVPPKYQGKGVAGRLVRDTLEMIKAEGKKVVPICPFVTTYIQRHPEYMDLVSTQKD